MNEPRRSARLKNLSDNECDVSKDLWADEEVLDNDTPTSSTPCKWLSNQIPPSPPTTWKKCDLGAQKFFSDPPVPKLKFSDEDKTTPFGIFNLYVDDDVVDYICGND